MGVGRSRVVNEESLESSWNNALVRAQRATSALIDPRSSHSPVHAETSHYAQVWERKVAACRKQAQGDVPSSAAPRKGHIFKTNAEAGSAQPDS